jgi:hypothetical protein
MPHAAPTCLARACPGWWPRKTPSMLGYAYCQWFKPRPAYRFSAEDSIYLAPAPQAGGWAASCWPRWPPGRSSRRAQADCGDRRLRQCGIGGRAPGAGVQRGGRAQVVRLEIRPLAGCGADGKVHWPGDTTPRKQHEKQDLWRPGWPSWAGPLGLHRFYLHGLGDMWAGRCRSRRRWGCMACSGCSSTGWTTPGAGC